MNYFTERVVALGAMATVLTLCLAITAHAAGAPGALPSIAKQGPNTWLKRSPRAGAPANPRKGYESSMAWDPYTKRMIRHGGHRQGGGGPQYFEVWTLDPTTMKFVLRQPNTSPPGVCCVKDNVFDHSAKRFVRYPAFSDSHGWQWQRMIQLRNWTAWTFDNASNTWRNMRPLPTREVRVGRCATYDRHHNVNLIFDKSRTRTGIYDLYTNTWTNPRPPKQPAGRTYGSMVYDSKRRRHVMFGRHYGNDPATWAYDIALNQWQEIKTEAHPPSDRTCPVMSYDTRNDIILCVLLAGPEAGPLQTWVMDCKSSVWKKLKTGGEPLGTSRSRDRLMTYIPELDIHLMENRTSTMDIWTYRYTPKEAADKTPEAPGRPIDLAVVVNEKGEAKLSWKAGVGPGAAGYRLFRAEGKTPWKVKYAKVGPDSTKETSYTDKGLEKGKIYHYRVAALNKDGKKGDESLPVRTQPRVYDHFTVSVLGEKEVEVSWPKHTQTDVVGYNIYRADVEVYSAEQSSTLFAHEDAKTIATAEAPVGAFRAIGEFKKVNTALFGKLSYIDKSVDLSAKDRKIAGKVLFGARRKGRGGKRFRKQGRRYRYAVYAYRVRAVNALGVESGPSPWLATVPSAVEDVFSKEEGNTVHLKWDANPEKKIKGYHVYRLNDRVARKGKVTRLTKEPVTEPKYSDTTSGKVTRRFFIIAVDALGQEGIPSSPVWGYRTYHKHYAMFGAGAGTWHQ